MTLPSNNIKLRIQLILPFIIYFSNIFFELPYYTMSTDYHLLIQKFNNFKNFVKEISKSKAVSSYESMTDSQFLLFGLGFLVPNADKLEMIVQQIVTKLEITDDEHMDKITQYMQCFTDYLQQLSKEDNINDILLETVKEVAREQNITLPEESEESEEIELPKSS